MSKAPTPSVVFKTAGSPYGTRGDHLRIGLPTGDVIVTAEDVDSETAARWLETYNTHNRSQQDDRVSALVRDMLGGSWLFNGDSIRFAVDADGKVFLADGQHRLRAIAESETTQLCLIVRGLPAAAQEVIDTNKVRTFGDSLKLDGWSNENHIGAITRMLLLWERNVVVGVGAAKGSGGGGGAKGITTKPELYAYLNAHADEIRAAIKIVYAVTGTGLKFAAPASKLASAWVLLRRLDEEAADIFIVENVIKGLDLHSGHPAKVLRDRLLRTDIYRPTPAVAFLLTLHAWKHWRNGTELDKLQAPKVWAKPDEFGLK